MDLDFILLLPQLDVGGEGELCSGWMLEGPAPCTYANVMERNVNEYTLDCSFTKWQVKRDAYKMRTKYSNRANIVTARQVAMHKH
jgi:hypothetical protein